MRLRSLSDFFGFSINFRRHKNIFILDRFENCWMFWKAMPLNRSFLRSTSFGVRFWYPLSTHPSSDFFEWFLVGFLFGFGPPMVDIPLRGVPQVPADHQKHRESTLYSPLSLPWKFEAISLKTFWDMDQNVLGGTSKSPPHLRRSPS